MPYTADVPKHPEPLKNMPAPGPPVRRLRAAQPSSTTASDPKASSGTRPGAQASAQSNRPAKPRFSLPTDVTIRIAIPLLLGLIAQIAILVAFGQRDPLSLGVVLLAGMAGILIAAKLAHRHLSKMRTRLLVISQEVGRLQDGDYRVDLKTPIADEVGLISLAVNRLATAATAREKRLMENALVDPLTGLANRSLLTDRIRSTIALANRNKGQFSVAVLDLDRFKIVNDTMGHAVGDLLLKEVARRLKASVRESDTVARLGGDEFVLLMHGGADAAREVASRIVQAMSKPMRLNEQLIDVGVSIGISVYPDHGQDDATLLRHADKAMYRAKQQQQGPALFDGDMRESQRNQLSMLGDLRNALRRGQFELHYQPQLKMKTGLIVGLEGLVRWRHPTRGMVAPNEFIPFAEQSGFMRELTPWVVLEGAKFAAELSRLQIPLRVSVNVSTQDIENEDFCTKVTTIFREHGLKPGQLCLEITESGVLSETETALRTLQMISDAGVMLSVDDFGTGYATLKQLQRLPLNELKIDRSFVSELHQNRGNLSIVRATIDLAKQLGLTVVAEGVETVTELRTLARMGCDEVQGYFLSKPMPAKDVAEWVKSRHALHASSKEMYFEMLTGS
jgi:diguanylate cyclase (GGDEF)-like protein